MCEVYDTVALLGMPDHQVGNNIEAPIAWFCQTAGQCSLKLVSAGGQMACLIKPYTGIWEFQKSDPSSSPNIL